MITSDVENYPGYPDGDPGPGDDAGLPPPGRALRRRVRHRRRDAGRLLRAARSASTSATTSTARKRVIVATGASARQLGLESERALQGRGVSYCAVCDARVLPRQRGRRRRRRRLGDGGGDLPDEVRDQGHARPPARRVPRLADHARPRPRQREDRVRHADRRRGGARRGRRDDAASRLRDTRDRRDARARRAAACSSRSATTRTRRSSSTSSTTTRRATSSRSRARPRRTSTGVFAAGDVVRPHLPPGGHGRRASGCMARARRRALARGARRAIRATALRRRAAAEV